MKRKRRFHALLFSANRLLDVVAKRERDSRKTKTGKNNTLNECAIDEKKKHTLNSTRVHLRETEREKEASFFHHF